MVGGSVDGGEVVDAVDEVVGAVVADVVGVVVDEPAAVEVGWSVLGAAVDAVLLAVVGAAGAVVGSGAADEKPDVVGGLGIAEDDGPVAPEDLVSVGAVTGTGSAAMSGDACRGSAVDPVPHAATTAAMTRTTVVSRRAGR